MQKVTENLAMRMTALQMVIDSQTNDKETCSIKDILADAEVVLAWLTVGEEKGAAGVTPLRPVN